MDRAGMISITVSLVAVSLLATPSAAQVTIGFQGLVPGGSVPSYSESGYTVTPNVGNIYAADEGGGNTVMFPSMAGAVFTLVRDDGLPFDLFNVDLGEINGSVGPQTVQFVGYLYLGGAVNQTFVTDGVYGRQTFALSELPRSGSGHVHGLDAGLRQLRR